MNADVAARWSAAPSRVERPALNSWERSSGAGAAPSVATAWLVGCMLLIGAIYATTAWELAGVWATDPNYSHGFLVPCFAAYFAWGAIRSRPGLFALEVTRGELVWGCAKVAFGLILHIAARFFGHLFLDVISLVCVLRGAVLALAGRAAHRELGFATLFLIFMARLPHGWHQFLAGQLQELASVGAAACFEILQIPVFREGYRVHLPGQTLEVGEACSGLRQLTTCLALGAVVAYLFTQRHALRWIVTVAALPVAVLANCLRVVVTGLMMRWLGVAWGQGTVHSLEGLLTMAISAGTLVGLAWFLSGWNSHGDSERSAAGAAASG